MVKGTFIGDDIDFYLSREDVSELGCIEIKDNKIRNIPLEVFLENDLGKMLSAVIQVEDFDSMGDGIVVERVEDVFHVRVNERAYDRMENQEISGTRYDGMNKINFRVID